MISLLFFTGEVETFTFIVVVGLFGLTHLSYFIFSTNHSFFELFLSWSDCPCIMLEMMPSISALLVLTILAFNTDTQFSTHVDGIAVCVF